MRPYFALVLMVCAACLSREGIEAACPCVAGFTCCETTQRCLPALDSSCPAEPPPPAPPPPPPPPPPRPELPPFTDVTVEAGLGEPKLNGIAVAITDLDGDGALDLAFGCVDSDRSGVFFQRGPLSFERQTLNAIGNPGRQDLLLPMDFTGDGGIDLMMIGTGDATPPFDPIVRQPGGALVREPADYSDGLGNPRFYRVQPIDFDADGLLDLLGIRDTPDMPALEMERRIIFMRNNGDGVPPSQRFSVLDRISLPPDVDGRVMTSVAADLDVDGDVDLVVCGERISVFSWDTGRFVDRTAALGIDGAMPAFTPPRDRNTMLCSDVELRDADADGRLDIVYHMLNNHSSGHGLFLLRQTESGMFERLGSAVDLDRATLECEQSFTFQGAALAGSSVRGAWLDADSDGDLDYLSVRPHDYCGEAPMIYWSRFADGGAGFEVERLVTPSLYSATAAATGDLDGDGDVDVAVPKYGPFPWALLRNNLVERTGDAAPRRLAVQALTDLDGDATDPATEDDRSALGQVIELDLDGPEDTPDFQPGRGKLQVRVLTSHFAEAVAHFGLGTHAGPVHVRVHFADGSIVVQRVEPDQRSVIVRDVP